MQDTSAYDVEAMLSGLTVNSDMALNVEQAQAALAREKDPLARTAFLVRLRAIGDAAKVRWDEKVAALTQFVDTLPPPPPAPSTRRTIDDFKCVVCMDDFRCCRGTTCAHVCLCESCAAKVCETTKKCPLCIARFDSYEKVIF